jgi:hypothetical protein
MTNLLIILLMDKLINIRKDRPATVLSETDYGFTVMPFF